jgi:hypothetical protein
VVVFRTPSFITRLFFIFPIIALLFGISSCSKDPVRGKEPYQPPPVIDPNHRGVYVIDEGNYNWGNSSVTYIDLTDSSVSEDVFKTVNGSKLGDVAEGMKIMNGKGYIVVNNSNKIEVVTLPSFESYKTITGFNSPRNIEFVDSTKAYVTNLLKDISIVDLKSMTVTRSIALPGWTEGMVTYKHWMFVTCIGVFSESNAQRKAKIVVIDTDVDKIVDSIASGKEPVGIILDERQKLWVLCTGGFDKYEPPSLIRVNPDLMLPEKVFTFSDANDVPSRLSVNTGGDTLYFLNNGVFRMPVTSSAIPATAFIPSDGRLFYGLGIDPVNGNIFVSDAIDFVQNGKVYRYNQVTGTLLNEYTAERIPGSFCFPKQAATGKK